MEPILFATQNSSCARKTCNLCHQSFVNQLVLDFHYDVIHKINKYICNTCLNINDEDGLHFSDLYGYIHHMKDYHEYDLKTADMLNLIYE